MPASSPYANSEVQTQNKCTCTHYNVYHMLAMMHGIFMLEWYILVSKSYDLVLVNLHTEEIIAVSTSSSLVMQTVREFCAWQVDWKRFP